ncbi:MULTISPECIES: ArsR family transcriptional regulator [Haloarcula]|uniref:ArsR family transcriptional regulator n=1 Tax=Haloarcula TaxID=2237 RepID=UPI0023EC7497|nr:ArsR family transcriptional regulator [Halomicroarcula sp. XH51]
MAHGREDSDRAAPDRVPLDAIVDVFRARDDVARPLTASDIMDEVGCSRRTAHNKLNELVEEDVLKTRKVGSRSRVWWEPIHERPDERPTEASPTPEQLVEEVDLPGTGTTLKARQEALLAAYEYLREHPEAKKSDFLQDVFPENPAEYETAEGWWNAIQPALAELPGVNPPEERGHIWHFLGG